MLLCGSTHLTNLKKICSLQKHAIRIVFNKTKFEHIKELSKLINVLNLHKIINIYKYINILRNAVFMHRVNTKTSPTVFTRRVQKIYHLDSTTRFFCQY